jgi:hypothetical protein
MEGFTEGDTASVLLSLNMEAMERTAIERTAIEGKYGSDESPRNRECDRKTQRENTPRSIAGYARPTYLSPHAALPWAHEQAYHEILSKLELEKAINDSRQALYSKTYENVVALNDSHNKLKGGECATPSSVEGSWRQQNSEDSPYRNVFKPQQQAGRLSALRQRSRKSLSSLQAPIETSVAIKDRVHMLFNASHQESLISQPLAAAAEDATADGRVQKADRPSEKTSKRLTSGQSTRHRSTRLGPRGPVPQCCSLKLQRHSCSGDLDPGCHAIHAGPASREAWAAKHAKAEAKGKMAYWPEWQQELTKGALRVQELDQQLDAMRSSHHSMVKMARTRTRLPSLESSLERTRSGNVRGTTGESDRQRNSLEDRRRNSLDDRPSLHLSAYQAPQVPPVTRQGREKKAGKNSADALTPTLFSTLKTPFWPLQANALDSNELNRRSPSRPPSPSSLLSLSSLSSEGQRASEGRRGRERGRKKREKGGKRERGRGGKAREGSVDATNLPLFTHLPSFVVLYGEVARPRKLAWHEAAKVPSDPECHNPKPETLNPKP